MNLATDIFGIIFIIGVVQGIILSNLLFTKYRSLKANVILAWLILLYSLFVLRAFLSEIEVFSHNYPHLLMLLDGLPFLFGPLHLMYVGKLTDTRIKFAQIHWLHFVPFILWRIYYFQVFFLSKEELNQIILQISQNVLPFHIIISTILVAIQGLIYVIVALFVFKEYSVKIKSTFSSLEKINLKWLFYFTVLAFFVWIVVFIENMLSVFGIRLEWIGNLVPLLTSLFVYATGYIGMLKTEIFTQYHVYENIHELKNSTTDLTPSYTKTDVEKKYQKSGLTDEKAIEVLEKLRALMEKDQLFTDSEITLRDLARKAGTSTHNISEVINTRLSQNFFDFINNYRIQKVKKDLVDRNKNYMTLFGIANEAGFNSKSGFNAIFKRYTGKTPSEYREQINLHQDN